MKNKLNENMSDLIKGNIELNDNNTGNDKIDDIDAPVKAFRIKKKGDDKIGKKPFQFYLEEEVIKKLDKACKKSGGYSRNEMLTMMIEFCLDNFELEE